jgi:hypothetical protein
MHGSVTAFRPEARYARVSRSNCCQAGRAGRVAARVCRSVGGIGRPADHRARPVVPRSTRSSPPERVRRSVDGPHSSPSPNARLTVRLYSNGRASPPILAIVDSGADESVIHIDIATYLGIDVSICVTETGYTATGEPFTTYRSPVTIEALGLHFSTTVSFARDLDPTEALLGQADVFNEFLFAFDQRR